jgi:hypothetical protein
LEGQEPQDKFINGTFTFEQKLFFALEQNKSLVLSLALNCSAIFFKLDHFPSAVFDIKLLVVFNIDFSTKINIVKKKEMKNGKRNVGLNRHHLLKERNLLELRSHKNLPLKM